MKLGHTGTRKGMTKAQLVTLRELIDDILAPAGISATFTVEWHHGCSGKSDMAGSILAAAYGINVVGHPCVTVDPQGYWDVLLPERLPLDRNDDIARHVDLLFATPAENSETPRGGTWATVRRARKYGTRHIIIYRDGTYKEFPDD
jgi:hypothetical protein